jgi:hypothetical protein
MSNVRFEAGDLMSGLGRQPRIRIFSESCLWKFGALDAHGSLQASLRTHTIGHQLSFADGDWATASDGKEPLAAVGRTGALDPLLPVVLQRSGPSQTIL